MTQHDIENMEKFLEVFNARWDTIKNPEKELEKYIYIAEGWIVWLKQYWDMCIILWSIDVSDDLKNNVEQVKILVQNALRHEREKGEI